MYKNFVLLSLSVLLMLFVLLIFPFSVLADEQKGNYSFFSYWEVGDW